jgi:hypothetical protein
MSPQLVFLSGILTCTIALAACGSRERSGVEPVYDPQSGMLQLVKYDANRNGRVDTWIHVEGSRIVRAEVDGNEDGTIDRWEHYEAGEQLDRIGVSTLNDGKEDVWLHVAPDGAPRRVDISTGRDGRVTRTEYYENKTLTSAEEDGDGDGRLDKWERYENGRLVSLAFDTSGRGTPDRRLVYAADGSTHVEAVDGSGRFVAVDPSSGQAPSTR